MVINKLAVLSMVIVSWINRFTLIQGARACHEQISEKNERKKVRSQQRKVIRQGSKFLIGMCSSHQDCYVNQFLDGYVEVRYLIYRSEICL